VSEAQMTTTVMVVMEPGSDWPGHVGARRAGPYCCTILAASMVGTFCVTDLVKSSAQQCFN
jgi:hypothetical protein